MQKNCPLDSLLPKKPCGPHKTYLSNRNERAEFYIRVWMRKNNKNLLHSFYILFRISDKNDSVNIVLNIFTIYYFLLKDFELLLPTSFNIHSVI